MDRSTYNKHRVFAGVLLVIGLVVGADYYAHLGLLGQRQSKGILILLIAVVVIYGSYFSPTREDMRQQSRRDSRRE